MKKFILTVFIFLTVVCTIWGAEKEKKSLYKKFTNLFDKAATKVEEKAPEEIEKGMETLTDNLEDFENDIHAEPKKQSKFAKLFNYIADIDITETCANDFVHINPEDVERVGAYTDAREEK